MQELLSKSAQIVNGNIAVIALVGICNLQIFSGILTYLSLIGLLASFVISIIIYGRIAAQVECHTQLQGIKIIKINWLNYIIVAVVLSIPVILYNQLSQQFAMSTSLSIYEEEAVKLILNILTIYVLPIVFIKKQHIISILAGVTYFFQHLKSSIPIIMLVVAVFVLNLLAMQWLVQNLQTPEGIISLLPAIVLFNVGIAYISFLIFTAACIELIHGQKTSAK